MKSTGEVMGVGASFGDAFSRAQLATGQGLPEKGEVFISVNDRDKTGVLSISNDLRKLGFSLLATRGTAEYLNHKNVECLKIHKVGEGAHNIEERILSGAVKMVINTPLGKKSRYDETAIRRSATQMNIPCITTLSCARAAVDGIRAIRAGIDKVTALQQIY